MTAAPGAVPLARALDEALASDAFFHDPYPTYARLREHDPVHWVEQTQSWLLTRYDDVARLFPQHRLLSNYGFQRHYFERLRPEVRRLVPALEARGNAPNVLTTDPPAHARLRKALQAAFTPAVLARMEAMI